MAERTQVCRIETVMLDQIDELADRMGWRRTDVLNKVIAIGVRDMTKAADRMTHPMVQWMCRAVATADDEEFREVLDRLNEYRNQQRLEFA